MSVDLPAARLLAPEAVPALRWGVIGTGIAGSFVGAIHAHTTQRAVAVAAYSSASRSSRAARTSRLRWRQRTFGVATGRSSPATRE